MRSDQRVMITGGVGYIGRHAVLALLGAGFRVVVIDNLSSPVSIGPSMAGPVWSSATSKTTIWCAPGSAPMTLV